MKNKGVPSVQSQAKAPSSEFKVHKSSDFIRGARFCPKQFHDGWGCNTRKMRLPTRQALSFDNNGLKLKCRESIFSSSADPEVQARCPDDRQSRWFLQYCCMHNIIPHPVISSIVVNLHICTYIDMYVRNMTHIHS